ncbi:hypothetical protein LINPERHAP1_LOCUS35081 [Linum perenne]
MKASTPSAFLVAAMATNRRIILFKRLMWALWLRVRLTLTPCSVRRL